MYPLSDKDLDRLSREAAEQFAVEPHASDWDQLASKLDKELPVQKDDKKRRALWLLLILLLTCGGGLFWLLADKGTATNTIVTTTTPSQETVADNSSSKESANSTENSKISADKEINKKSTSETNSITTETEEPSASNSTSNTITPTTTTDNKSILSSSEKTKKESPRQQVSTGNQKQLVVNKKKASFVPVSTLANNSRKTSEKKKANNAVTTDNDIVKNNTVAPATNNNSNNKSVSVTPPTTDAAVGEDTKSVATVPATIPEKTITTNTAKDSAAVNTIASTNKKAPTKKSNPSQKGLSIGVIGGFDYSRINNTADNKPGYNVGLQVSYELTKRWSFNTGFILTKKNYTAAGKDFHPPKHYWTTYIALDDVEGNCQMWDIPLNIRYNLTTTKTKWFINTGFSTYIMRKQYYNYYYTVNNTAREKDWSMNSQTNYWFNVLNVSAGVEKQLNRTWSIQAEPFIKAPLKGVGFGNMSINSYGVLATLKFHPVFKR